MPEALPRVSVVVPSLDQAAYVRATLESLLSQGYPDLEVLVQDGGSTDGSVEVLREYEGRVSVRVEKDRGQADAINRGLARATGEVLGYLNSDDVLFPGALRAVGEAFASRPEAVLVYGRAAYVGPTGERIAPVLTRPWEPERLPDLCYVAQPAAFFRREVLEEIGPFDESLHHAMDYDYWLRIAARYEPSRVVHLDRELAGARLHPEAKSVGRWGRGLEEVLDLLERRAGYVSLWWLVAKWDHRVDGRLQALAPHPVPWRAYPPAILEFLRRNPPRVWKRGLGGAFRGFRKRLAARR
ncbi:MAG: glycosyltransferase [Acidobacteria bacterium]|nr:MAG: glycosyltransferase [Acidobacteriota bacterium]MCE7957508.1 glycosyltransferase [Acidobacteria bacterium ACB2]